ncbi:MAG: hypothetical protein ACPLRY_05295 [Candidatus Bathyarchaeales archaeon]
MAMQRITLGTVAAIAVIGLVASVLGALVATQNFNNTATIKAVGVGVYSNSQCTVKVTAIDWGVLSPGETRTQTIYVKNEGNVPIVLSLSVGNWTPSEASVISVTWNRQGAPLAAGSSVSATLSLTVPASISGVTSFSFVITITGTEQT